MQVPYPQLTDEEIRAADVIAAVDPATEAHRWVFGQTSVPQIRPYPSGPYALQVLEVLITGFDPALAKSCRGGWRRSKRPRGKNRR